MMGVDEASFAYEFEFEYEKLFDELMIVMLDECVVDVVNDLRFVVFVVRCLVYFVFVFVVELVDTMVVVLVFVLVIFLVDFIFSILIFLMDCFLKYKYVKIVVGVKM